MIKNGLATNWLLGRSWNNKFITNVWQRSRYKNNTTHIPSHRIYLITEQYFNVVWNVYILYEVIQGYKRKKKMSCQSFVPALVIHPYIIW